LERLHKLEALELEAEARTAATTRIIEASSREEGAVSRAEYRSVSKNVARSPTPKEAFMQAFNTVRMRIEVLPGLAESTSKKLNRPSGNIVWRLDTEVMGLEGQSRDSDLSSTELAGDVRER
jgi:hypothetical protein